MSEKTVNFGDNRVLPAIGQGTWYMGEKASQRRQESDALRAGIERGLTLIDTAEMYAEGGAEEVVGEAIKGQRDKVFWSPKSTRGMPVAKKGLPPAKPACAVWAPIILTSICCTGGEIILWQRLSN